MHERESSSANEFDEAHAFENFGFLHKLNTERFAKTFAKTFGRTCAKHSTNCKINKKLAKQNKREKIRHIISLANLFRRLIEATACLVSATC